jgi:hypothetical protein
MYEKHLFSMHCGVAFFVVVFASILLALTTLTSCKKNDSSNAPEYSMKATIDSTSFSTTDVAQGAYSNSLFFIDGNRI